MLPSIELTEVLFMRCKEVSHSNLKILFRVLFAEALACVLSDSAFIIGKVVDGSFFRILLEKQAAGSQSIKTSRR